LVHNTIATYKSCATTALVLSTGSEETLAERKENGPGHGSLRGSEDMAGGLWPVKRRVIECMSV
jgi:hypothetical protein